MRRYAFHTISSIHPCPSAWLVCLHIHMALPILLLHLPTTVFEGLSTLSTTNNKLYKIQNKKKGEKNKGEWMGFEPFGVDWCRIGGVDEAWRHTCRICEGKGC